MTSTIRNGTLSLVGLVIAATLSGCTTAPTTDVTGGSAQAAIDSVPSDVTVLVYDISPTVIGAPSSYNPNAAEGFTVLAACGEPESGIGLAVIPSSQVSTEIHNKIRSRFFDQYLAECTIRQK